MSSQGKNGDSDNALPGGAHGEAVALPGSSRTIIHSAMTVGGGGAATARVDPVEAALAQAREVEVALAQAREVERDVDAALDGATRGQFVHRDGEFPQPWSSAISNAPTTFRACDRLEMEMEERFKMLAQDKLEELCRLRRLHDSKSMPFVMRAWMEEGGKPFLEKSLPGRLVDRQIREEFQKFMDESFRVGCMKGDVFLTIHVEVDEDCCGATSEWKLKPKTWNAQGTRTAGVKRQMGGERAGEGVDKKRRVASAPAGGGAAPPPTIGETAAAPAPTATPAANAETGGGGGAGGGGSKMPEHRCWQKGGVFDIGGAVKVKLEEVRRRNNGEEPTAQQVWGPRREALSARIDDMYPRAAQNVFDAKNMTFGSHKHPTMNMGLHVLHYEGVIVPTDRAGNVLKEFNGGKRVLEEPRRKAIDEALRCRQSSQKVAMVDLSFGGWQGWTIPDGQQNNFHAAWALLHQMERTDTEECDQCRAEGEGGPPCKNFHRLGYSETDYKLVKDNLGVGTGPKKEDRFGFSPLSGRRSDTGVNSNSRALNARGCFVVIPYNPWK